MFTGIIEEQGRIISVHKGSKSAVLEIAAKKVLVDVHIGDSISTNGACLTVTAFSKSSFSVDVMAETMRRTNLDELKPGSFVNLERALRLSDRIGGHLVSGHIDGTGIISELRREDNAVWVTVSAEKEILKYMISKGSVAIDGISLTVAEVGSADFKVSIIPQTANETNLTQRKPGDKINLECDLIGKYIERFVLVNNMEGKRSPVDLTFLQENGFA